MKITRTLFSACVIAGTLLFAGGPGSSGLRQVSLHIPNETAPPDGVAQMKFMVTEPTPISSGKPVLSFDDSVFDGVLGVELFNPTGSVYGVAMIQGSSVSVRYINSNAYRGTDYPIMTVALHVRPDARTGSQTQFSLDPSTVWIEGLLGAALPKPAAPATITVGGSVSITNVVPGGGRLPAGAVVSVRGIGFEPKTQVQLDIKASSIVVTGPQEIQITLAEATDMTGKKIQVVNPDGSQDTYFSYMRGITMGQSNRPLLAGAIPIFAAATYSYAIFAPLTPSNALFAGVALQNPSQAPVNVTVALYSPFSVLLGRSTISVPAGHRMMREISELTGGASPTFGSYVEVSSSQPVQVLGFVGDEAAGSVLPFTPVVARP